MTAADAAAARRGIATHQPGVVVCETWLPGGGEAALLTAFVDAGVPVVAVTTAPEDQLHVFRDMRLSGLVMKPCLPDELIDAVQRVVVGEHRK